MSHKHITLAMSGGVDSAAAALLLRQAGYDVSAVTLRLHRKTDRPGICGSGDDIDLARSVAASMGLPHTVVDLCGLFRDTVMAHFVSEYVAGRTPNPCVDCNREIKFGALLDWALAHGADFIATGHYARVTAGPDGRMLLRKGQPANDQSYMLSRLTQALLRHIVFPLGGYEKVQVRALAEEMGLFVAHKPDSMEICFIPDGDYAAWLDRRGPTPPPGNFIDGEGRVLGRHLGIHHYTIGQGRGLGVSGPHRYFVSSLDPEHNTVTLSDGSDLMADRVLCSRPNWIAMDALDGPMEVTVRLRHSRTEAPGVIRPLERGGVDVLLDTPARAPTPGQLAVFYQGDVVIGSAWIERSLSL